MTVFCEAANPVRNRARDPDQITEWNDDLAAN
jgi:hypothetical protein